VPAGHGSELGRRAGVAKQNGLLSVEERDRPYRRIEAWPGLPRAGVVQRAHKGIDVALPFQSACWMMPEDLTEPQGSTPRDTDYAL